MIFQLKILQLGDRLDRDETSKKTNQTIQEYSKAVSGVAAIGYCA
jgi:hypothetical protein